MSETPYYFNNGSYRLFGILYQPDGVDVKKGFLFCHPFAEEKLWTQLVFVNFARELVKRHYAVLRFDFMGHGDSEGDFENSTIETRLSDIRAAYQSLHERVPSLETTGLLGLRFGATLAALSAEKIGNIDQLILWDPIVNGHQYMQEMLRINLTTQSAVYKEIRHTREDLVKQMRDGQTVNIDGYEIGYDLYEQCSATDLLKINPKFDGKTLIVQISRGQNKIRKDLDELAGRYKNAEITIADEFPFWKEIKVYYPKADNLFNVTLKWLTKHT